MEQQTIKPFDKLMVNGEQSRTIKCAFCKGTGENLHFKGTCPVCKGKGKNQITGKYMACSDCHGSGQKRGTTLTCYTCAGLGVIPDTREELRRARQEIRKVREEMEKEKDELRGKQPSGEIGCKASHRKQQSEELIEEAESDRFCQSCAELTKDDDIVKVCLKCFEKIKKGNL